MINLSLPAYVLVVLFCIYSASGIENRRQRWLRTRSPWDLARMVLASTCLVAVVIVMPLGGSQMALYPIGLSGMANIALSALEDGRTAPGSGEG